MRILLDWVSADSVSTGTGWMALAADLVATGLVDLHVLDRRSGAGPLPAISSLPGALIKFPGYQHRFAAADSLLIQAVADQVAADVFLTTGFTTPTRTASAAFCLPWMLETIRHGEARAGYEVRLNLLHAAHIFCDAWPTFVDLTALVPGVARSSVSVIGGRRAHGRQVVDVLDRLQRIAADGGGMTMGPAWHTVRALQRELDD